MAGYGGTTREMFARMPELGQLDEGAVTCQDSDAEAGFFSGRTARGSAEKDAVGWLVAGGRGHVTTINNNKVPDETFYLKYVPIILKLQVAYTHYNIRLIFAYYNIEIAYIT